ncbi:MAG TPA: TolC family protein [Planctomycetota bacterium]|nr:TolC family protein [Planctomycetota bacterium]
MYHRRSRATPALVTLATLAACTTDSYVADADDEVAHTLRHATEQVLGGRDSWVVQPALAAPPPVVEQPTEPGVAPPPEPPPPVPATTGPVDVLDLQAALAIAVAQNRDYLSRRESLYREGLSITLTRFQFGPQFEAAVTYLWPRGQGGFESQRSGTTFSGSQILPTGGRFGVTAAVDADWPHDRGGTDDPMFGSNVGVSLTQPLLRGAGYEVSHEALTQGERSLVYSIRDFELYRENFTIQVSQRFFALASQRKTLANEDANYASALFDRQKAEALQQVGRSAELDVFRARRQEIEAKDRVINLRAAYDRAVDEFKILLGVPTTASIDIADIEPPYEPARFEVSSAIAAALHNRLDLITQRQSLEDSERSLRIAENNLLPDLTLNANYGLTGVDDRLDGAVPDSWGSSVGLSFEIPLQRKSQRNSYRSALISLEQARRDLKLREEQLELDIRDAVRNLRSLEERIVLQEGQIKQEKRAVTVTEIRYESGTVENRDLLEAKQAYTDAQNALIQLKVEHFVARLNLLKDMGVFFVDDKGMWR